MIVCDLSSDNVHVISSDCSRDKVLVDSSRGIGSPDCVMYSGAQSTLYVGRHDSDTLKVFKLK